jgi:hypothetical protein
MDRSMTRTLHVYGGAVGLVFFGIDHFVHRDFLVWVMGVVFVLYGLGGFWADAFWPDENSN